MKVIALTNVTHSLAESSRHPSGKRLLDLADHPNVRANFDPGNFAYCREDPLAAWMVLHDLVGYAHFKDVQVRNSALQYCSLGDGVTDWPPLIEAMLRDDYHGYWAIEYEEPSDCVQGTERCLQVLRTAVGRPASVGR
jgi:sugar phosphate isomerase/epimerase